MKRALHVTRGYAGAPDRSAATGLKVGLVLDATQEAEMVLEQEAQAHPTYADVRQRLGLLRLLKDDPRGGEREFEEALGINPGYRAAYFGLRMARMHQGLPMEALRGEEMPSPAPAEERLWRRIDEALQLVHEGTTVTGLLDQPQDENEEQLHNHYSGYFAYRAGDLDKARVHFEAAANASPIARGALERIGILPWNGDDPEALRNCMGKLFWSPLAEDLYTYLARIYARNGLRDEALECCERAYLVLPRRAQFTLYCAEIAVAFGEEQKAIELLTQAIESDPTSIPARIALGYEYASQGFLDEARTQFEVAANLAPGYADVRYNLGLLFVGEGKSEEALAEFRRALAVNPAYLPARHSMSHLLCRMGRYEEGLQEYGRILKQGFQSGDMLVQMGKATLALDRVNEALQYLERGIFLNPEFAASYYYIGQAYQRKGLKNKARSAWRTYLEKANEWEPMAPIPPEGPAEPGL